MNDVDFQATQPSGRGLNDASISRRAEGCGSRPVDKKFMKDGELGEDMTRTKVAIEELVRPRVVVRALNL